MELRDLSPSLGAEVVGLDIAQPLDEATITQLRRCQLANPGIL